VITVLAPLVHCSVIVAEASRLAPLTLLMP
jgi:hypothetical protein